MAKHAKLSPSGAEKWIACPAAPAAEGRVEHSDLNIYAAEGTAAHFLASECSHTFVIAENLLGTFIYIDASGEATWEELELFAYKIPITETMIGYVQKYLDDLKDFAGEDGIVFTEQRLDISSITGEQDAGGTSDAVVIREGELQVHDLKYGMKAVEAYQNKQLLIYAAAAVEEYSALGYAFDQILLVIHQPRVGNGDPSTHAMDIAEFEEYIGNIKYAASIALSVLDFDELGLDVFEQATPGDHCHSNYCKARDTCPALHKEVMETSSAMNEFLNDLDNSEQTDLADDFAKRLGELALKVPMIESYCELIMARVSSEILSGKKVLGFKPVLGRQGNREWAPGFEEELSTIKVKKEIVYKQSVLSPTEMEEIRKAGKISESQWKRMSAFIHRSPAKVTVAPVSDKRPAVEVIPTNNTDGFEALD